MVEKEKVENVDEDEKEESEPYAEGTPLTSVFGDHPKTRILATLLSEKEHDVNVSEIARMSGMARSTVYEHIDDLVDLGIVENTREVSMGQMYKISEEDDLVQLIDALEWGINFREIEGVSEKSGFEIKLIKPNDNE